MLKIHEIKDLIRIIDQSSIDHFSIKHEGSKIEIVKRSRTDETEVHEYKETPAPTVLPKVEEKKEVSVALQQEKTENESDVHTIVSPMVGTFYSSPGPNEKPFVQAGEKITETTVVCIVEAMKLFNEIEAEVSGEVVEQLVEDGQLVEYGQPLVKVKLS
ncbi:acetyl-CoA carboxylase biotin carboxyl carrier protein [Halalkalibacter kiskunsagensis]|uniref:Biotin carboxyl carrier protein of acetyl-CoA carboxylase n=1 Tax=Halalkalibacter kiskunsagensis TaxID=1548599 RepID=A0ABV6KGS5_9BACI